MADIEVPPWNDARCNVEGEHCPTVCVHCGHCADCGEVAMTEHEALHELWDIIRKIPYRDMYAVHGTDRVESVMRRVREVVRDA